MKVKSFKKKDRISRYALRSIFLEEARRISDDEHYIKAAADEAVRMFALNHPDLVEPS